MNPAVVQEHEPNSVYKKLILLRQDGSAYIFLVKFGATMGALKKGYAIKAGCSEASFKLLFNGRIVNELDTTESLRIRNDDVIDVVDQLQVINQNLENNKDDPEQVLPANDMEENELNTLLLAEDIIKRKRSRENGRDEKQESEPEMKKLGTAGDRDNTTESYSWMMGALFGSLLTAAVAATAHIYL